MEFDLVHTVQTLATALLLVLSCIFASEVPRKLHFARLPLFGGEIGNRDKRRDAFMSRARELYTEGYHKFKDCVFRMSTHNAKDFVIVSPKFLPELRKLPDDVLSITAALDDALETRYTKLETGDQLTRVIIKADLNPALVRMNSHIVSEVERALVAEIPPCEDWTEVSIYVKLARIVARVSGRVFVGPELCHDDDYLDTGVHYTLELMECLRAVKRVRPILRSLLAPRLPETQKLRAREKRAQHILQPLVQARSEAVAKGLEKPDDLLQWLLDRSASQGYSTEQIARVQLGLTFAAIHTTTTMTINMLYTLAAAPAYVQPLREEIRSVVEQHGGEMTTKALMKMEKLDSFMRETMRLYPLSFASFMRKVLKGITLSNGQYIPAGTIIEVAQYALNQELGADFDPLRAYAMRQAGSATTSARSQFVSVSESYLGFGYGNHACPGRFFAANEIKTILAKMLLRFEVRNAGGVQERYPNLEHGAEYIPDASRKLLLKRVAV